MTTELEEQLTNGLVILPPAPFLLSRATGYSATPIVSSHRKTIWTLLISKKCGLIVRRQPDQSSQFFAEGTSQGCIYVPAPHLSKIVIIKNVNNISDEKFLDTLNESINWQLICIDNVLSEIKREQKSEIQTKVQVDILISVKQIKEPKRETTKSVVEQVTINVKEFFDNKNFTNVKHCFHYVYENNFKNKLLNLVKAVDLQGSKIVFQLCMFYFKNLKEETDYQILRDGQKFVNGRITCFQDVEAVCKLHNFYFPDRDKKIEFIPHINNFSDNKLFENDKSANHIYVGEVEQFLKLISVLKSRSGILLRGLNQRHLETIVEPTRTKLQEFEIDWLYLGSQRIVAIEVGLPKNAAKPTQTIVNKIDQCLTKTLPQFFEILYTMLESYSRTKEELVDLSDEVFDTFDCIVYLPKVTSDVFTKEVSEIGKLLQFVENPPANKKKALTHDFLTLLALNRYQVVKYLKFLLSVEDENSVCHLKLLRLNEDFEITENQITFESLFHFKVGNERFIEYASALFAVSALNVVEQSPPSSINLNNKYLSTFNNWTNKNSCDPAAKRLVLSPQQHGLLNDKTNTHLIITGHPGTGKTTLLLAKCEQMASSDDIKKINFVFGRSRRMFGEILKNCVEKNCSKAMKKKLTFSPVGFPFHSSTFKATIEESECDPSEMVVVIDEVSYTSIDDEDCNFFCDFKVCWISLVENGQPQPNLSQRQSNFVLRNFRKASLDINFRNARHICNITNHFIEQQFVSNPYSTSVKTDGSFTAGQLEIECIPFDKIDYDYLLTNKIFLDNQITDRLIVIISDVLNDALSIDNEKMKQTWKANEIVFFTSNLFHLLQISGVEFQSVLIIIDVRFYQKQHNFAVNDAVSRAQFEVGIIARKTAMESSYLKSYLAGEKACFVNNSNRLFAKETMSCDWLKPNDLDLDQYKWWDHRLKTLKIKSETERDKLFTSQPIRIRLQIVAIISEIDLTAKLISEIETEDLADVNLLYWCVLSRNPSKVEKSLELLSKKGILLREINKLYPGASIIDIAVRLAGTCGDDFTVKSVSAVLNTKEFNKSLLLNKFDNRNVFEYILFNTLNAELFRFVFSDDERCDLFFIKGIGFEPGEVKDKQIQKYRDYFKRRSSYLPSFIRCVIQRFCTSLLPNNSEVVSDQLETFSTALTVLKKYPYILHEELHSNMEQIMEFLLTCIKSLSAATDRNRIDNIMEMINAVKDPADQTPQATENQMI